MLTRHLYICIYLNVLIEWLQGIIDNGIYIFLQKKKKKVPLVGCRLLSLKSKRSQIIRPNSEKAKRKKKCFLGFGFECRRGNDDVLAQ